MRDLVYRNNFRALYGSKPLKKCSCIWLCTLDFAEVGPFRMYVSHQTNYSHNVFKGNFYIVGPDDLPVQRVSNFAYDTLDISYAISMLDTGELMLTGLYTSTEARVRWHRPFHVRLRHVSFCCSALQFGWPGGDRWVSELFCIFGCSFTHMFQTEGAFLFYLMSPAVNSGVVQWNCWTKKNVLQHDLFWMLHSVRNQWMTFLLKKLRISLFM